MQINILLLFLMISLSMVSPAPGQTFVKEGKLYLHTNSKVTINGEVHNQGSITNEGLLSVSGDWHNVSSYTSSSGAITLVGGTDTQIFSHNNQAVYNLTIAGSGDVRLAGDVTVEGKLVLYEGVITPEPEARLILAEKAVVEGGAANAYVNGKMYHTGLGRKFYPVGKNEKYAPVTLDQVSGDNPVTGVEFYDKNFSFSAQRAGEIQLTEDEFLWDITSLSGKFDGSPITLDMAVSDPILLEEEKLVIAGSDDLEEGFETLDKAKVQIRGERYIFSSSLPVQSRYITIGVQEDQIQENQIVYIPNVLSPLAADPEDKAVKVYSESIADKNFHWTIWDNWGHIVYTTNSYEQASATGWQGNHKQKGEALPGTYKYLVKGTFKNGQTFSRAGSIVLYK